MKDKSISIIGAGAMGTALGVLISENQKGRVKLWDQDPDVISQIRELRENFKYLPEIKIPKEVSALGNLDEALQDSDLIILAVPSFAVRSVSERVSNFKKGLPPILTIAKGIEKETSLLPFQIIEEVLNKKDFLHLAWVGFAKEFKKKKSANIILASNDNILLKEFKNVFKTGQFKMKTSTDLIGVQLAGALKNVIAIGIGMTLIEAQENPKIKNQLIKEGIQEMISLGKTLGAKEKTFLGPVGKGDLEISSTPRSRNYCCGKEIYQRGIMEIEKELQEKNITVEGFYTAWAIHQLAKKYGLNLPIAEEVYQVIYEGKNPRVSAQELIKLI